MARYGWFKEAISHTAEFESWELVHEGGVRRYHCDTVTHSTNIEENSSMDRRREQQTAKLRKTAEKLLLAQLKKHALQVQPQVCM